MRVSGVFRLLIILAICISLIGQGAFAGSFVGSVVSIGGDIEDGTEITHPPGYNGTGGELVVSICVDPSSPNQDEIAIAINNVSILWNALEVTTGNVQPDFMNDLPRRLGINDYESVLAHEVGHCLGIGHGNMDGPRTGLQNYTSSHPGPNGSFDLGLGADLRIGTADDIRGDDINRFWFSVDDNNPLTIGDIVDRSTYSIDLIDLPIGDTFPANGDGRANEVLGFNNTESVMISGVNSGEVQRTLVADDVATLRLGMSGLDEIQGTADDYTVRLEMVDGADGCDIPVSLSGDRPAICRPVLQDIPGTNHSVIINAEIQMSPALIWYFNPVVVESPVEMDVDINATGSWLNSERDGEGWVIEKLSDTTALFYWFTYPALGGEESGDQIWLLAVGNIEGNRYVFDEVMITDGATFGPDFDPADISSDLWGSLTFEFTDDDNGTVTYSGPPEYGSGNLDITRFVVLGSDATPAPALPVSISGSWFDQATDGEGWVIEVINATQAVIYWFTFDENGDLAWNVGVAEIVGNSLVLDSSLDTTGTFFGTDFDANAVERNFFSGLTLTFNDCNNGTLVFASRIGAGQRTIQRITNIDGLECTTL